MVTLTLVHRFLSQNCAKIVQTGSMGCRAWRLRNLMREL